MELTHKDLEDIVITFLAALAPMPSNESITREMNSDRTRNPHNDSYKPQARSAKEVEIDLRLDWVRVLLDRLPK